MWLDCTTKKATMKVIIMLMITTIYVLVTIHATQLISSNVLYVDYAFINKVIYITCTTLSMDHYHSYIGTKNIRGYKVKGESFL